MKRFIEDSVAFKFRSPTTRCCSFSPQMILFALCFLGIWLATSATAAELVSVNSAGTDSGNDFSGLSEISADGRFVVFFSNASDLGAVDTNGVNDLYVRDLQIGTTTLVSVNRAGTDGANGFEEDLAVISANGRFVAFSSAAGDLVATDTNGEDDVFVRDLQTVTTTLASINSAGGDSGNNYSFEPEINADGRFVAFVSNASDLVTTDTNGNADVYVRDLQAGTTTLISVNSAGSDSGNDRSFRPKISADGRFVAFRSGASNLVATDTNEADDVFVRDLQAGTTTLVSVNSAGADSGNNESSFPKISADGRFVAFQSRAGNLVATNTDGVGDVYVRDLQAGTTTLVSVDIAGTGGGNNIAFPYAISSDGRFVAFSSDASNLVATDTNNVGDIFVRDLQTGTTTLVSINSAGTDGGNGHSFQPKMSSDGRFVAFNSFASDLLATDTNGGSDVFVRDLQAGTTILVSVNSAGTDSGNDRSFPPVVSSDGRVVAFASNASDLVAVDTNGGRDVFVFEFPRPEGCDCNDPEAITGGGGADFLLGTQDDDIICGFEGNDLIFGRQGNDCIDGGDGTDIIFGGRDNDHIFGQEGEDKIFGNRGDDTIDGGDGFDKIAGGRGTDVCANGEFVVNCEP